MPARYLIRFDDICPTMDWDAWERVEALMLRLDIKPLLAVVPDNRDPMLQARPARSDFWTYIRQCQARGWTIAMHGWQHLYESSEGGLLRINRHSEFSGLPVAAQQAKIAQAAAVFARESVRVDAWIAPGHNFDAVTLEVLAAHGIGLVSDGFFFRPVRHRGHVWLPQQLWRFRSMPFGTWTVCLHINHFDQVQLDALERDLLHWRKAIVDTAAVLGAGPVPQAGMVDHAFAAAWRLALLARTRRAALPQGEA